eukprot:TRINITY_DN67129_c5_g1_i2.p1 TRINITY_DN67129_c5_g1~~TRINITY_DN67129_c5_g1_i2.p1  ORF type:complete len:726 (-),score=35.82 TRINITY_DN67129_c5_g1_i2:922-3099(-)
MPQAVHTPTNANVASASSPDQPMEGVDVFKCVHDIYDCGYEDWYIIMECWKKETGAQGSDFERIDDYIAAFRGWCIPNKQRFPALLEHHQKRHKRRSVKPTKPTDSSRIAAVFDPDLGPGEIEVGQLDAQYLQALQNNVPQGVPVPGQPQLPQTLTVGQIAIAEQGGTVPMQPTGSIEQGSIHNSATDNLMGALVSNPTNEQFAAGQATTVGLTSLSGVGMLGTQQASQGQGVYEPSKQRQPSTSHSHSHGHGHSHSRDRHRSSSHSHHSHHSHSHSHSSGYRKKSSRRSHSQRDSKHHSSGASVSSATHSHKRHSSSHHNGGQTTTTDGGHSHHHHHHSSSSHNGHHSHDRHSHSHSHHSHSRSRTSRRSNPLNSTANMVAHIQPAEVTHVPTQRAVPAPTRMYSPHSTHRNASGESATTSKPKEPPAPVPLLSPTATAGQHAVNIQSPNPTTIHQPVAHQSTADTNSAKVYIDALHGIFGSTSPPQLSTAAAPLGSTPSSKFEPWGRPHRQSSVTKETTTPTNNLGQNPPVSSSVPPVSSSVPTQSGGLNLAGNTGGITGNTTSATGGSTAMPQRSYLNSSSNQTTSNVRGVLSPNARQHSSPVTRTGLFPDSSGDQQQTGGTTSMTAQGQGTTSCTTKQPLLSGTNALAATTTTTRHRTQSHSTTRHRSPSGSSRSHHTKQETNLTIENVSTLLMSSGAKLTLNEKMMNWMTSDTFEIPCVN